MSTKQYGEKDKVSGEIMKNVLFVSLSSIESNNSAMLGNIALVRGLVENGCNVKFLIAKSQNESVFYDGYVYEEKNVEFVEIGDDDTYRLVKKSKSNNFVIKLLLQMYKSVSLFGSGRVMLKYVNKVDLRETHYDLVISASDPKATHLFTKKILRSISYDHWIQLWGDPLLIDITSTSKLPKIYKKYVEYSLLKSCDSIIYVSPLTLEKQKEIFKSLAEKMMFFPIPYEKVKFYPNTKNQRKRLGYFGNYNIIARDITKLYDAVKCDKSLELVIAGDSELKLETLENITVCPRVSREKVIELEENCDILVCIANKKGTQVPAKINYYSSTNKKILFILDGKTEKLKEYLGKYNRYIFCENEKNDILDKIHNAHEMECVPVEALSSKSVVKNILEQIDIKMRNMM